MSKMLLTRKNRSLDLNDLGGSLGRININHSGQMPLGWATAPGPSIAGSNPAAAAKNNI